MAALTYSFVAKPATQLDPELKRSVIDLQMQETRAVDHTLMMPAPTAALPHIGLADEKTRIYRGSAETREVHGSGETLVLEHDQPDNRVIRKSLPNGFILQKYQINNPIGEGGFGITYRANDELLRRQVAVKECFVSGYCFRAETNEIFPSHPQDDQMFTWAKFFLSEEARITFTMRHDNIVRIYDFFQMNNTAYIVYELLNGPNLHDWRAQHNPVFRHGDVIDLFQSLCNAVKHIHDKGFIHRDIKPSNIMMASDLKRPILIDFGAAIEIGAGGIGDFITPGFSPLEQYESSRQDERSDIYALCATMYWAISGNSPPNADLRRVKDDLVSLQASVDPNFKFSARLYQVIDRGLSLDPKDRYPNVQELINDLFPKLYLPATGYSPTPRGTKVFLSYRQEDSSHFAGRLVDFLEMRFGSGSVFIDVVSIPTGIDFWDYIKGILDECAAVLVVIGPRWIELLRRRQKTWYRANAQVDYVTMELTAAIDMKLPIIPIVFDGSGMPNARDLPYSLRPLLGLNAAIFGRGTAFRVGADNISDQIAKLRTAYNSISL